MGFVVPEPVLWPDPCKICYVLSFRSTVVTFLREKGLLPCANGVAPELKVTLPVDEYIGPFFTKKRTV